jgi:hypothetical protein
MSWSIDARIPVALLDEAVSAPETALLLEAGSQPPDSVAVAYFEPGLARHGANCACCVPRGEVARALDRLFLARARGELGWFRRVVVVCGEAGQVEVLAALGADPVVSARFRLA